MTTLGVTPNVNGEADRGRHPEFHQPVDHAGRIAAQLSAAIIDASVNTPRSRQHAIGPSEIGHPCTRRIAYKLMQTAAVKPDGDPWPSISGTAIHAWLADVFGADDRYLVETPVQITPSIRGTVDLYDTQQRTVIDHKCAGATGMRTYRETGPSPQQITQVSLYAYGLEQAGHPVEHVALAYYPLGGWLTGMHVWVGDYDRQLALDAIDRVDHVLMALVGLDVEDHPDRWVHIPATPSRACAFCPWHNETTTDLSLACPGESQPATATPAA